MKTKRILMAIAVTASSCLISFYSAYAARIYNSLNFDVSVQGVDAVLIPTNTISIPSNGESASLSWTGTVGLHVTNPTIEHVKASTGNGDEAFSYTTYDLCGASGFSFNMHAQIQGGNYMVIGQRGTKISCVVCDAGHNVIATAGSDLSKMQQNPAGSLLNPYNSQYYGC